MNLQQQAMYAQQQQRAQQTAQERIVELVTARGHLDGWTWWQFFVRQICKALEELCELAAMATLPPHLQAHLAALENVARSTFNDHDLWQYEPQVSPYAWKELADLLVTVFCAAQALGEVTGQPFDIVQVAVEKAAADVSRGVR